VIAPLACCLEQMQVEREANGFRTVCRRAQPIFAAQEKRVPS
jgi:hypothetical protein